VYYGVGTSFYCAGEGAEYSELGEVSGAGLEHEEGAPHEDIDA